MRNEAGRTKKNSRCDGRGVISGSCVPLVLGSRFVERQDGYEGLIVPAFLEFYQTISGGKEGVIFSHFNIQSGEMNGTTLANDDVSCFGELSAINFHAEAFAVGFATVTGTTGTFLVSHIRIILLFYN